MMAYPPLLTPDETATLLRTSRQGVYAAAARGQLPGVVRLGRRLLIRRDDLLAFLGLAPDTATQGATGAAVGPVESTGYPGPVERASLTSPTSRERSET